MSRKTLTLDSKISQLPPSTYNELCRLLDDGQAWKDLACQILNRLRTGPRFTTDDIHNFERSNDICNGPSSRLLQSWQTDNITIRDLTKTLERSGLLRQSHFIREIVEPGIPYVTTIPYATLAAWSNNFDSKTIQTGGHLLGEGGFSEVFKGTDTIRQRDIAIKRLKVDDGNEKLVKGQIATEIEKLSICQHKNLVLILGYSNDGPRCCIVYELMLQGSLADRLAFKDNIPPLQVQTRITIIQDVVEGIAYLHKNNFVHRDVKSANILLSEDMTAKVGDYGTARSQLEQTSVQTTEIIGTNVYMAPEYILDGVVSFKIDSYSLGVVLLELLTGLPACDDSREEKSLVSYVQESENSIYELIDSAVKPDWSMDSVQQVYGMSEELLSEESRRPTVLDIVDMIKSWHC